MPQKGKNAHRSFVKEHKLVKALSVFPTLEAKTQELGSISDLQAAEEIMANKNTTLRFDATTEEGRHVNSIQVTTENNCYSVEVDKLPGETAQDYSSHICDSIENPANAHAYFYDGDQKESKKLVILSNQIEGRIPMMAWH